MSIVRHHTEWLSLVLVSGSFLSLPLLMEALSQGFSGHVFDWNGNAMRARAQEILGEIERETEAIRSRFAAPPARMFPVAVTFLVAEKLA